MALTLINELDMEKFDAIEKLIEKKVYRAQMPDSIGKGPEWKVRVKRNSKGKKPFRK